MHPIWWALVGGGALLYAVWLWSDARWRAGTAALRTRVDAARIPSDGDAYDPADVAELPPPVRRFFDAVLSEGIPRVTAVSLAHHGSFLVGEARGAWAPFTSTQRVVVDRPGFDWDAVIDMVPGVPVWVHDALVEGEGVLKASVWGLLSMVDRRDRDELARGELMRFLAEAAWYPTALLPGRGVEWTPVDDCRARATLTDGDLAASLTFRFDEYGHIVSVYADARGRTVGEATVPTPWEGRFWNYQCRAGMLVPTEGEVAWLLPEGRLPYWRGRIDRAEYEF